MGQKNKILIYEISGIIIVCAMMGIIYNHFSSKPLPLIYNPEFSQVVEDSEIDNILSQNNNSQIDSAKPINQNSPDISKVDGKKTSAEVISPGKEIVSDDSQNVEKKTKTFTYNQLKKNLGNEKLYLIDARNADLYNTAHIGKAINIFPDNDNNKEYMQQLMNVPENKLIVVYCDGGLQCELSRTVARDLIGLGYKKVYVYEGGWEEWSKLSVSNK